VEILVEKGQQFLQNTLKLIQLCTKIFEEISRSNLFIFENWCLYSQTSRSNTIFNAARISKTYKDTKFFPRWNWVFVENEFSFIIKSKLEKNLFPRGFSRKNIKLHLTKKLWKITQFVNFFGIRTQLKSG